MSESARVTSIDAIREFHASLCNFKEEAQEALCAVDMEIRRMFAWLEDRLKSWQREVRALEDEVVQARNDLERRKMSRIGGKPPDCTEQEAALRLARRRLEEAEEKVVKTRRWGPELERMVDEYQGSARQLAGMVEGELPRAFALLEHKIALLESYVSLAPPLNPQPAVDKEREENST